MIDEAWYLDSSKPKAGEKQCHCEVDVYQCCGAILVTNTFGRREVVGVTIRAGHCGVQLCSWRFKPSRVTVTATDTVNLTVTIISHPSPFSEVLTSQGWTQSPVLHLAPSTSRREVLDVRMNDSLGGPSMLVSSSMSSSEVKAVLRQLTMSFN